MAVTLSLVLSQEVGLKYKSKGFSGLGEVKIHMVTSWGDPCPVCDFLRPKRAVAQPEVCSHTFIFMGMPVKTIGPAQSPERPVTSM